MWADFHTQLGIHLSIEVPDVDQVIDIESLPSIELSLGVEKYAEVHKDVSKFSSLLPKIVGVDSFKTLTDRCFQQHG